MIPAVSSNDPSSFANDSQIKAKSIHLDLKVDFNTRIISGFASIKFVTLISGNSIILDSSFLDIKSVSLNDGTILNFTVHDRQGFLGSPFEISHSFAANSSFEIKIVYATTSGCTAIQWLDPISTAGKKHPYLFSQCQAIHARSLLPCQDSPNIKIKYTASVTVDSKYRALMSAIQTGIEELGIVTRYSFSQDISIPSYLIAIAVGNIKGIKVGPRTTVWSEPEVVESAAWEFRDTEKFISTGESFLSPYCWGIYDLLLLPSSFPYGGMENPCLTFVTPSLLAGDRSLVDVVAHEIAHSWAGNLVTSASWEHFWLNEGFTVFIERKISGRLHGEQTRQFDAIQGLDTLRRSIDGLVEDGHPELTCLCPKLFSVDPDDAFSSVPYEKGFNLLYYLETLLGGPNVFEPYVKAHFDKFAHTSITTQKFKDFLYWYFMKPEFDGEKVKLLDSVDWTNWFSGVGMPKQSNHFDQTLSQACEKLADVWTSGSDSVSPSDLDSFSPSQKMSFLDILLSRTPMDHNRIKKMGDLYKFNGFKNCEIRFRWQYLCLKAEYEPIFPEVTKFVVEIGRMKYVRPLYKALFKCKNGKKLAVDTFLANKSFYHSICAYGVSKDLELIK